MCISVAMEFAAALQAVEQRGDYQALYDRLVGSGRYRRQHLRSSCTRGQAQQRLGYSNPTVDRLLEQARGMTDIGETAGSLSRRCGRALRRDLPITYL